MKPGTEVPVLLLGYNRPDLMLGLIKALREVRPLHVFVSLDGPAPRKPLDYERCHATRDVIAREIDWPCQIQFNASQVNLGCRLGVSGGISWFFQHVSEGIILEDDCWPSPDFFTFCEALLARYRNDPRVAMISGNNFQQGRKKTKDSYYFSKFTHIWGWATWRRAWQRYDLKMTGLDEFFASTTWLKYQCSERETKHWSSLLPKVRNGEIDTWDYQWSYSVWKAGALVALPAVNLVSNQGFRPDATHTVVEKSPLAALQTEALGRIKFLPEVEHNLQADHFSFETLYAPPPVVKSKDAAKPAVFADKAAGTGDKNLRRAASDLAVVKASLAWRLVGKHLHSLEKRIRRLFGA